MEKNMHVIVTESGLETYAIIKKERLLWPAPALFLNRFRGIAPYVTIG
jgi:hypothetical protein